jgi:hypothetical protein
VEIFLIPADLFSKGDASGDGESNWCIASRQQRLIDSTQEQLAMPNDAAPQHPPQVA